MPWYEYEPLLTYGCTRSRPGVQVDISYYSYKYIQAYCYFCCPSLKIFLCLLLWIYLCLSLLIYSSLFLSMQLIFCRSLCDVAQVWIFVILKTWWVQIYLDIYVWIGMEFSMIKSMIRVKTPNEQLPTNLGSEWITILLPHPCRLCLAHCHSRLYHTKFGKIIFWQDTQAISTSF